VTLNNDKLSILKFCWYCMFID